LANTAQKAILDGNVDGAFAANALKFTMGNARAALAKWKKMKESDVPVNERASPSFREMYAKAYISAGHRLLTRALQN